ncbi:kinase-like protein [Trametes meyenii]|nr:kinase-like protein [Trametes meyenii]
MPVPHVNDTGAVEKSLPYYAVLDDETAKHYEQLTAEGVYNLIPSEEFWKERHSYLERRGYTLRPRYSPKWQPSWKGTHLNPTFCEDSIVLVDAQVIDARRINDNQLVAIKKFRKDGQESSIAQYLSSFKQPQNHSVAIYEILPDPIDPTLSLMVMPYLRPCNDPDFATVGDVVDFVSQTLEGLAFLHRHDIAHRDVAVENIMMDAASLYPDEHHPVRRNYSSDALREVSPLPRSGRSVTYKYIDFGLSIKFSKGASPLVVGRVGRDKEAPELSSTVPYNAFKIDIFALGNLYHKEFEQKYNNMHFLVSLAGLMTQQNPDARPTVDELMLKWEESRADVNDSLRRWRLGPKAEPAIERVLNDTVAVAWEGIYHLKKFVR